MWIEFNNNPVGRRVGDCSVRAVSKALGILWEDAYTILADAGYAMGNMPSANEVIAAVLRQHGFYRRAIPDTCPDCYTTRDFCEDFPRGTYVLSYGEHVACVQDGAVYGSWNSLDEVPQFFWYRKDDR